MMRLSKRQTRILCLCNFLFITLNISNGVDGRLGNSNIFLGDDDDAILDGDFVITFTESANILSTMSHEDVSSLADDIGSEYSLQTKTKFYDSLYGFTASNMTKQDLSNLQNDERVLFIEKDIILSIDLMENKDEDEIYLASNRTNRTLQSSEYTMTDDMIFVQEGEMTPPGVQQVGWKNIEDSDELMSRRVFVIDSGVSNPDDELNIDTSLARNFVNGESANDWSDCNGHGTHVAGTIAARQNGRDVVGVAAGAMVVPIRVLDCTANGAMSQIIMGINYVAMHAFPGDVVNLSIGGPVDQKSIDFALERAASTTGAKFVVAAGNGSTNARKYSPARVQGDNIYTVCALNGNGKYVAGFSNFGKPPIQVCAPGTNIVSLSRYGGITTRSGTSMAAPHVSGALLLGSLKTNGMAKSNRDGKRYRIVQI